MSNDAAARFRSAVKTFQGDWAGLDVRAIALRGRDEQWHLRLLRVTFVTGQSPTVKGPRTQDIWTGHEYLTLDQLDRLLDGLTAGAIEIDGKPLVLKSDETSRISLHDQYFVRDPRFHSYIRHPSSVHSLGTKTSFNFPMIDDRRYTFEMALPTLPEPWEDYADVVARFAQDSEHAPSAHELSIQFLAPVGVDLQDVEAQAGVVRGRVHCTPLTQRSEVNVAIIQFLKDREERRQATVTDDDDGLEFKHPLNPAALRTVVVLSYRGLRAGYWSHVSPRAGGSPFVRATYRLLGVTDLLGQGVLNPEIRGAKIEPWVHALFAGLGFNGIPLGAIPGDIPDLLFQGDGGALLVVECTEDTPDINDKLGKLSNRCRALRTALEKIDLIPVVVTRLAGETIPESHRKKARDEGIALLAREDLVELGEMLAAAAERRQVQEFIRSKIPIRTAGGWGRRGLAF